jgi:aspartate racemase
MRMSMEQGPIIGIVGGVGPYAGLDLSRKVLDQTRAATDQDHLNMVLLSWPRHVPDRSAFLLGRSAEDPVPGMVRCVQALEAVGATVAGIACNTAHSPRLFGRLISTLRSKGSRIVVINMIQEVARFIQCHFPDVRRVGVLATDGTVCTNTYGEVLDQEGFATIYPDAQVQRELVHSAIYDLAYGIKAYSAPVTARARSDVLEAARHLVINKGAEALVLGCTELPLAVSEMLLNGKPVIDASMVLARALVASVEPDRLKPVDVGT